MTFVWVRCSFRIGNYYISVGGVCGWSGNDIANRDNLVSAVFNSDALWYFVNRTNFADTAATQILTLVRQLLRNNVIPIQRTRTDHVETRNLIENIFLTSVCVVGFDDLHQLGHSRWVADLLHLHWSEWQILWYFELRTLGNCYLICDSVVEGVCWYRRHQCWENYQNQH
jgi:hypothetical protein